MLKMLLSLKFAVRGQAGEIPGVGLGTATLFGDECISAIRNAIKLGYRHFDTAFLYNNQESVGEALKQALAAGDVRRDELWVTSKVAFYPNAADGKNTWIPIAFHASNKKGFTETQTAIDECLAKLQLDYVDLMLVHNACTDIEEYQASAAPHFFELFKSNFTQEERKMILQSRLSKVQHRPAEAEKMLAATWLALEQAQEAGKARFIGVSNFAPLHVINMEKYARVMPAVNQLEFHPRFSSPSLQALAARTGMVLVAYGSGNSVALEHHLGIAAIAQARSVSSVAVVLQWTRQLGVGIIPRSTNPLHLEENLRGMDSPLTPSEMAAINALNEAHPYYWSPIPLLPPGSPPDC